MSLRTRLALAFALVAAVVSVTVGALSFHAASDRITDEIDQTLRSATVSLASGQDRVLAPIPDQRRGDGDADDAADDAPTDAGPDRRPDGDGDGAGDGDERRGLSRPLVAQTVTPNGAVTGFGGRPTTLPVSDATRELATDTAAGRTDIIEIAVGDDEYRVLTTALGGGRGALQVAADVDESNRVLTGMAIEISTVSGAVLVVAAAAGWLIARRITRRLVRLTAVAEDVSEDGRVEAVETDGVVGRDEVGRLAASINTMLARIASSRDAQDRLVQDAAHELRTPLTSLRTNASVLRRAAELSPEARERLLDDVQGETRELTDLVNELVALALARRSDEPEESVALGDVVERAATRVRRRSGRQVHVESDGSTVLGRRQALERAVGNLLENAAKFDADGSEPIEVRIDRGTVTVSDRGPGIADGDTARVFDRFYRSEAARALPGSGLGLSIVRDTAEGHGGTATARRRPGGGATVGFGVGPARLVGDAPATGSR